MRRKEKNQTSFCKEINQFSLKCQEGEKQNYYCLRLFQGRIKGKFKEIQRKQQ